MIIYISYVVEICFRISKPVLHYQYFTIINLKLKNYKSYVLTKTFPGACSKNDIKLFTTPLKRKLVERNKHTHTHTETHIRLYVYRCYQ